jgi:hypothetical protein
MSYVLHIWETPLPASFDEAAHVAFELGGDQVGQNPGFLVLAGRLTARYPCITVEAGSAWSDGPLDGKTGERVYVLGVSERHAEVIAYVAQCAGKLGLTVFDMQASRAYLPSGQVLTQGPTTRVAAPEAPPCDGLRAGDVRIAIHEGMMRVLGELGFVHDRTDEHALVLHFPGGFHRIGVPIYDYYPLYYECGFHLATRLDQVSAIAASFSGVPVEHLDAAWCSLVDYAYLCGEARKMHVIDSRAGLALAVTEMNIVIVKQLLPLLDQISDLRGMDNLFNGPASMPAFQLHRDDGFNALTLARLAGNADYPALCQRYLAAVNPGNRRLRRNLPRLIAYLDQYDAQHPAAPPPVPFEDAARFITEYDGSQFAEIDLASNGEAGQGMRDLHAQFRIELMREAGPAMAGLSLRLLRDLFRAEAKACTAMQNFQACTIADLSQALLSRGGVGELALFAECMPLSALDTPMLTRLPLAADMAEALRYACAERTSNPLFGERAVQYAALEAWFASLPSSS